MQGKDSICWPVFYSEISVSLCKNSSQRGCSRELNLFQFSKKKVGVSDISDTSRVAQNTSKSHTSLKPLMMYSQMFAHKTPPPPATLWKHTLLQSGFVSSQGFYKLVPTSGGVLPVNPGRVLQHIQASHQWHIKQHTSPLHSSKPTKIAILKKKNLELWSGTRCPQKEKRFPTLIHFQLKINVGNAEKFGPNCHPYAHAFLPSEVESTPVLCKI